MTPRPGGAVLLFHKEGESRTLAPLASDNQHLRDTLNSRSAQGLWGLTATTAYATHESG